MTDALNVRYRKLAKKLRSEAMRLGKSIPSDVGGFHKDLWSAAELLDEAADAADFNLSAMLAAAPKTEPVSDPYKLETQWIKHFRTQPEAPKVEQEPAAWVPIHPRTGPIWSECSPNARTSENLKSYAFKAVFTHPAPASDELLEALKPLARLEVPKRAVGNAGAYSILHSDILRAADLYAKHKGPQS